MDSSVFKSYIYVQSEEDGGGGERVLQICSYCTDIHFCHSHNLQMSILYFFFETVTNNKKGGKNRIFF